MPQVAHPRVMSVVTNCQGPVLVGRFLRPASQQFKARYRMAGMYQIQLVQPGDLPDIARSLEASDVILAQPLVSTPYDILRIDNLRDYAQRKGKQLILFPALHFSALTPGARRTPKRAPGYPFGATEDLVLAGCYALGLPVPVAERLYHGCVWLPEGRPKALVDAGIKAFRSREADFETDIQVADFYAANWRRTRLHYIKSHPTADVYRHLLSQLAPHLGLDDLDLEATGTLRGNAIFALPHMAWLREALDLEFDEDPGMGRMNNEDLPFSQIIAAHYSYYDSLGRRAVLADMKQHSKPLLKHLTKARWRQL